MMRNLPAAAMICLLISASVFARSEWTPPDDRNLRQNTSDFCYQRVSDTIGGLWLVHSNRMAFGKPFLTAGFVPDDEEQVENLPRQFNATFSGSSSGEYLYAAGLWVGGIKGGDTLVSHAFDYVAPVPELNPTACPDGALVSGWGLADSEHEALAADTAIVGDTTFRCQVGDCRDWYPLGIEVRSHSYAWQSPPYDRSIIVEYAVKNIDSLPLERGWVGIYADGDVGSGDDGPGHDISGYLGGTFDSLGNWVDLDIGYTLDIHGDPGPGGIDAGSSNGVFGVQVLGLSIPDYMVNFNWWVDNGPEGIAWGPRRADSIIRDLGGGSFAVACGDSNKYYLMSNGERDYNQVEAALVHPGWLLPGDSGLAAANGGDSRFLISAGPFDLLPGEEIAFTVAFIAGEQAMTNDYVGLWFDPSDPMLVSDYYELLHLDGLKAAAIGAASIFTEGYALPPPGPPGNFRLTGFDDEWASFVWARKYATDMAGYYLQYSVDGETWQTMVIAEGGDTTATITGLDPEGHYLFRVASYDIGGAAGMPSRPIYLNPKAPQPPQVLTGISRQLLPILQWSPAVDGDVVSYRLYRIDEASGDTLTVADLSDTTFVDYGTIPGHAYIYYVTSVSDGNGESPPSHSLRLVPLSLSSGILVLDQNSGDLLSNLVFERAFFDSLVSRALVDIGHTRWRVDTDGMPTLNDLSQYSLVIVSAENRSGSIAGPLRDMLADYLANGGKAILLLRHAAVDRIAESVPAVIRFSPFSFFSRVLMIDSSYIGATEILPGYNLAGDLIGAVPEDTLLPYLAWDSVRVNQFGYGVPDGLPYTGHIWPREAAEPVYFCQTSDPESPSAGQVNGIRYKGDDYGFYLLNFPLSLMTLDSAAVLLRTMVADLGEEYICGDINRDYRLNIGDVVAYIRYLYFDGHPVGMDDVGDVNCDGLYDMTDLLILINYCLKLSLAPGCCR